jgi:radical SAM enzyme (TIGR01210 family)
VRPSQSVNGDSDYPSGYRRRIEWIRARRGERNVVDPKRPYGFFVEEECTESGESAAVATVFLTNLECPWTCLMCDLWKNTLTREVPPGAIPRQIDFALNAMPPARQIKLYNAGSFFDPRAIPPGDYHSIAERLRQFERVIVECHPVFVNESAVRFRDLLAGKLEVAMGLETAHPSVLEKLNKGLTLERFKSAAAFLRRHDIAIRTFILLQPPFLKPTEALDWTQRSIEFSFDAGAELAAVIPTRMGNGALESLAACGAFSEPTLSTFEAAMDNALALKRGRVVADLWDIQRFSKCSHCLAARRERLHQMNLRQVIRPRVTCPVCET